jgi:hypothetical protein
MRSIHNDDMGHIDVDPFFIATYLEQPISTVQNASE